MTSASFELAGVWVRESPGYMGLAGGGVGGRAAGWGKAVGSDRVRSNLGSDWVRNGFGSDGARLGLGLVLIRFGSDQVGSARLPRLGASAAAVSKAAASPCDATR